MAHPGLSPNYGVLENDPDARMQFVRDADAVLNGIGEDLKEQKVVSEFSVRSILSPPGYAGEIRGYYKNARGSAGVMINLNHLPDSQFTRDDGISGYAQLREIDSEGKFPPKPEDKDIVPLNGTHYVTLRDQLKQLLSSQSRKRSRPRSG